MARNDIDAARRIIDGRGVAQVYGRSVRTHEQLEAAIKANTAQKNAKTPAMPAPPTGLTTAIPADVTDRINDMDARLKAIEEPLGDLDEELSARFKSVDDRVTDLEGSIPAGLPDQVADLTAQVKELRKKVEAMVGASAPA